MDIPTEVSFEEGTIITPYKKGCISIVIGENIVHLIALGRLDSLILQYKL
jgi:hypothetical protein